MKITERIIVVVIGVFISAIALADVINIKANAPSSYTVQKGDTLWDISGMYLDKPWLWPELWRNNTQIENPHLIYPGDILKLRYVDGQPTFEVVRDKQRVTLIPDKKVVVKDLAISVLPWNTLSPFLDKASIFTDEQYAALPSILGDAEGTPSFANTDFVISERLDSMRDSMTVVRKQGEIRDSTGKVLGIQVDHIANASLIEKGLTDVGVIKIDESQLEARQGDKLAANIGSNNNQPIKVHPATSQVGELVRSVNGRSLVGKHDLVIINLGTSDVKVGTVMGIYKQGPEIINSTVPSYARDKTNEFFSESIQQPAFKSGELIVVKTFTSASYAWIVEANTYFEGGEHLAAP